MNFKLIILELFRRFYCSRIDSRICNSTGSKNQFQKKKKTQQQEMETLPSTAWDIIIQNLSYDDVISLTRTPVLRPIILDHISYRPNLHQFKQQTIHECIDRLEKDLDTNLFLENINFFIARGYKEFFTVPIYETMLNDFYSTLEQKCDFVPDNMKTQIQKHKTKKLEPQEAIWFFRQGNPISEIFDRFMKILKELTEEYEEKMGEAEDKYIKDFLTEFFSGRNGILYTFDYVSELELYIHNYLEDFPCASVYRKRLYHRLKMIVKIFEKDNK